MENTFYSWTNEKSKEKALASYAKALSGFNVPKRLSFASTTYQDVLPNISVRDETTRDDYENYRPSEAIPKEPYAIIKACMEIYRHSGLVRNIIDLMADFATEGIDIVHPSQSQETFYKEWAKHVHFQERSERFLNLLFRAGNVLVYRQLARLKEEDVKALRRGKAAHFFPEVNPLEIPYSYTILNPLSVEVVGSELSAFVRADQLRFALKLTRSLQNRIQYPQTDADRELVKNLPKELRKKILEGQGNLPLDANRVSAHYYKKDDWDLWADPLIYAVLKDLRALEKLKLADLAALDGAISHVRLWKIGNLEHKIVPNEGMLSRLASILINISPGSANDVIWGPDIELQETSTDIHRFLGSEKYSATLNAIYGGLGIPPTLTGSATQSGFTNNAISLKTLIERLQYGRNILMDFWNTELKRVQMAMGWRKPAQVTFDRVLSDESSEKALWIQMADRDLVSMESVQERFGLIPEIEEMRIRREDKKRTKGIIGRRSGPWHNPERDESLEKIFAQNGIVTPSELGLELEPRKEGEVPAIERKQKGQTDKLSGIPQQGRPFNSKDKQKRKQKVVKPRSKALELFMWAETAQAEIAAHLQPFVLTVAQKKNLRQLTTQESDEFEMLKWGVLCAHSPYEAVSADSIKRVMSTPLTIPLLLSELYQNCLTQLRAKHGKVTMEQQRSLQSWVYATYHCDNGTPPICGVGEESSGDTTIEEGI